MSILNIPNSKNKGVTVRFLVCSTGESVEENANVVVRLLIRRPECFGPALRGEGGNGLLAAIEEAIKISEDPARDGPSVKKDRRFPMYELHSTAPL